MNNGGPWGTGGGRNDGGQDDGRTDGRGTDESKRPGGPRRPNDALPEIEDLMKKGSDHLRVLMGGRGNGGRTGGPTGPRKSVPAGAVGLAAIAAIALWGWSSVYQVQQNERSIELLFGKYYATGMPGLNFAPWPVITPNIIATTDERTIEIGTGRAGAMDTGLMLTRDQNIVNIEFQVVWNISDPEKYLFNLADPVETIRAVSEASMRDIIARTDLSPILNRDRGAIGSELRTNVQQTLDSYGVGINIVRVNFNRADPPEQVIDSFRDVQAAQQERDRLEKEADAYANRATAAARGEAAQMQEQAEGYRAQVVNDAQGQASRFTSIYEEYRNAPDVTKRRIFLETMGKTLGDLDKVMVDDGSNAVPYLPLDKLLERAPATGGAK